jgi:hypothetical protein
MYRTAYWEDGYMACDCNRSEFFGLDEKYAELCEFNKDGENMGFPCGHTIEVLSIEEHPVRTPSHSDPLPE